ncbi:hypothetical protein [Streptomyces violascens]|uniref:hypothetical protein n=1 Tax=Streptomyces violascens TaxID=67381 RepID=UPI00167608EC|nr:hypothetical protein [Streptomyces violascens]
MIDQAGPVPDKGPDDPLVLSDTMRARFRSALDALLGDPGVRGRPDAERLAVVVLLAKAPVGSSKLALRAGEMARWLGFNRSYVLRSVLPGLRGAGAVSTEVLQDSQGYVDGLEWELLPLTAALGGRGGPLVLDKAEAATLLRFCERLFAPGWAPVDKAPTPPGLLGGRRGRGAATARLALLQLALKARPNGRVRLDGGAVKSGHRRAAATIGHLLGCGVGDAEVVLDDLIAEGLVEFNAPSPGSGSGERLAIPAVADAHGRGAEAESSAVPAGTGEAPDAESGCARCGMSGTETEGGSEFVLEGDGWVQEAFDVVDEGASVDEVGALRDQSLPAPDPEGAETRSDLGECSPVGEGFEVSSGVVHHASHAPLADVDGSLSLSVGFSGEAAPGTCGLPERAGAREDGMDHSGEASAAGERELDDPLRGEKRKEAAPGSAEVTGRHFSKSSAPRLGQVMFVKPASMPEDLALVLAPVRSVWERITRSAARRHVTAAVRVQLGVMRGVLGPQEGERVLADRLGRRLGEQMGRPVTDPVGWILGRGLVQRAWCWSELCDEGWRMDTGAACPSCQSLIGDRRGQRASVWAQAARDMAGATPQVLQAEVEQRLNTAVRHEAELRVVRHEEALAEQQARARAIEQRRAEQAAAEAERRRQPCADCGTPDAGGRCLPCTQRRTVEQLLAETVDLAVMARSDLADPAEVAEVTARCTASIQELLEQHLAPLRSESPEEVVLLFAARWRLDELRNQRLKGLRDRLMRSGQATAEADQAYAATMRSQHRYPTPATAVAAAEHAAEEARLRTAEFLLADRTRQLRAARGLQTERPVPTDWASRCAELAAQPLTEERTADVPRAAVSAA